MKRTGTKVLPSLMNGATSRTEASPSTTATCCPMNNVTLPAPGFSVAALPNATFALVAKVSVTGEPLTVLVALTTT